MLTFSPFSSQEPGTVLRLLKESYAPFLALLTPEEATGLGRDWEAYDRAVWEEADTVGASGFISALGSTVIGFASWDPRGYPERAEIGHNTIAPPFQGRGFGTRQVEECLSRLSTRGFEKVRVRTDEHPFFQPALKMYLKCGFQIVSREPGRLSPDHRMIVLERGLNPRRRHAGDPPNGWATGYGGGTLWARHRGGFRTPGAAVELRGGRVQAARLLLHGVPGGRIPRPPLRVLGRGMRTAASAHSRPACEEGDVGQSSNRDPAFPCSTHNRRFSVSAEDPHS